MFKTEIPSEHHLPALIHKIAQENDFSLALPLRSREVLLSRPSHVQAKGNDGKITHASVQHCTNDQASKQCHHRHLQTCHKGYHGRTGCRLCMKAGKCLQTGCVLLKELSQQEMEHLAAKSNLPCWCDLPDDIFLPSKEDEDLEDEIVEQHEEEYWSDDVDSLTTATTTTPVEEPQTYFCENDKKNIGIAFQAVRDIPPDLMPQTYSVLNILQKTKLPPLIVWETARRPAANILRTTQPNEEPLTKQEIIQELQSNLSTVRDFCPQHDLWDQLDKMPEDDVQRFYRMLIESFATANQYIASYNPPISYCTGAHNNAVLLGGDQQAKAATFYLCPYLGKLKFPLQDCLVILQEAVERVKQHPSVATDSGTDERTAKHVLQRCLNRLNMQMELSGKHFH